MKPYAFLLIFCCAGIVGAAPSPWDQGQSELKERASLPVRYPSVFEREREMRGYHPRFLPGMLTFTPDNRPVMRIGLADAGAMGKNEHRVTSRQPGKVNLIQYLDRNGKWQITDMHVKALRAYLQLEKEDSLEIYYGERTSDAVEFDHKGGAHTLVLADYRKNGTMHSEWFLLYSPDEFQTFSVTPLPNTLIARLEPRRIHADHNKTPWILKFQSNPRELMLIRTSLSETSGKLTVHEPVKIAPEMNGKILAQIDTMAGDGAPIITAGGKSFVVFAVLESKPTGRGVPHYIVEYDPGSGKVTAPLKLGTTGHKPDGHNLPVIDVDSKGRLHVIGGSHWHSFKHWISAKSFSSQDGWHKPQPIGGDLNHRRNRQGLSYPGMIIDSHDTIHLVARGRSRYLCDADPTPHENVAYTMEDFNYALVYLRKKADGKWEKRQDLVIPAWHYYSNWYHKVALDAKNRLFCTYYYFASWFDRIPGSEEIYRKRWPSEVDAAGKTVIHAHDPVLIFSDNGGDSWRIVQTQDF